MAESFPPCNAPRRIFAPGLLDGGILFTAPWRYNLELKKLALKFSYLDLFRRGRGGAWFQSRGVENAIKSPPTCSAPNMSGMQLIRLGKQNRFKFFVIRAKSLSLYLFFKSAICASWSCWMLSFALFPRPCKLFPFAVLGTFIDLPPMASCSPKTCW